MRKLNFSQLFKANWIHLLAVGLFFLTTFLYFQPQFDGYGLRQHDIEQFKGMTQEIQHYRDTHDGADPLWTNSMFGGMPTYQISMKNKGNWASDAYQAFQLWLNSPAGKFFAYLIGFYIMLMCMKIDPKIAILGAFAFAFSTYYIIVLQAGHNSKAGAIALIPPVIGAFYMAYQGKIKWGILLSILFMGMEVVANHVQVTYYFGFLLAFMGIAEFIRHYKNKTLPVFFKATVGLLIAYGFALGMNYTRLALTNDYAKHSIRGKNDITIHTDGTSNHENSTAGLDKDYITQWSLGVKESMTLLSPNVYGGGSMALKDSPYADLLRHPDMRKKANLVAKNGIYWGNQPFTSGPVYLGIIVVFLALLGMVYLKGPRKWALFAAAVLTLMLSWGKNFMGLTDFFLEHFPLYNKFRAVTIILVVVELVIPLLAVLFLNELFKRKEEIKNNIKPFYIASGGFLALMLVLTFTGLGNGYLSDQESDFVYDYENQIRAQIAQEDPVVLMQNGIDVNNEQQIQQIIDQQLTQVNQQFDALIEVRQSIYQSSMWRSVLFLAIGIAIVGLYLRLDFRKEYAIIVLTAFILIDLVPINLDYLNNEKERGEYAYWMKQEDKDFPFHPTKADKEILSAETRSNPALKDIIDNVKIEGTTERRGNRNSKELWLKKFQTLGDYTNYRVYNPQLGFNDASVSYFHKSLNGYHGAKLRRIQNVKDFYIDYGDMNVFNMLNVKYFIQGDQVNSNPSALGNAWFVKELQVESSPTKELLALGTRYEISNFSDFTLFVNGKPKKKDTLSGREHVVLYDEDSLDIELEKVSRSGINSSFVADANGNTNWIPTKELEKDSLNSFQTLLSVKQISSFEPQHTAIIGKEEVKDVSSLTFTGNGEIEMDEYAPNHITYSSTSEEEQFAVFSEMYYPEGWNAYIDGEQVEIHRVNYLLRGIEIPKGEHQIEMKFEVPKYEIGTKIALTGSILLVVLMIGAFVQDFVIKQEEKYK